MQTQSVIASSAVRATKSEAVANKQLAAKPAPKATATPLANVQHNAERTEPVVKLKTLLSEYKLPSDGKLARRFLRKAAFGWHSNAERWEFTESQAADVRAVLAKLANKSVK